MDERDLDIEYERLFPRIYHAQLQRQFIKYLHGQERDLDKARKTLENLPPAWNVLDTVLRLEVQNRGFRALIDEYSADLDKSAADLESERERHGETVRRSEDLANSNWDNITRYGVNAL